MTRPLSASPQVKACTAGYKGVNITTWGDSFNDGLAFCALLHKHDENVLNYDKNSDPKKALGNLDTAFTAAEKRWDVPRLLEPEELAGPDPTDEKSVITYVAKLRQAFLDREAEMMRKLKEEEEARKKAEREARQAALKKMVQDLKTGVDDWCARTTPAARRRPPPAAATRGLTALRRRRSQEQVDQGQGW